MWVTKILWRPARFLPADTLCSSCFSGCRIDLFTNNDVTVKDNSIFTQRYRQSLWLPFFMLVIFFDRLLLAEYFQLVNIFEGQLIVLMLSSDLPSTFKPAIEADSMGTPCFLRGVAVVAACYKIHRVFCPSGQLQNSCSILLPAKLV
jgi:hypothetical protein